MSDKKKSIAPAIRTIPLDYPVNIDGVVTDSVTMRRSKIKDVLEMEKAEGSALQKEVCLIAKLCSVPSSFIEELDESDYLCLQTALEENENGGDDVPLSDPVPTSESGAPEQPAT